MAEITHKSGTWSFDGDGVRVVPGSDKAVHALRQALGELTVPLAALAGVAFEPGRRTGRLRLRLREGSDPLLQATGGRLTDAADPYQLTVDADRSGSAEYLVDEVRNALLLEQVPSGPAERYLLPGPAVPLTVGAGDGTVSFDGELVRLEWNWKTEEAKKSAGPRTLALADLRAVEWLPSIGLENGYLRFVTAGATATAPPKYDPHAVELYGFRKDPLMALVAAAVTARLPHPFTPPAQAAGPAAPGPADDADGHDALLRRLRELGELHTAGVLTAEEFAAAKQAVLRRF
ncbi:DUF4429 domain-containing protein [Streptomyces sp. TRM 70351]|uniref:DUF4429 domain-containing protein n=1 Tax=Streptomyces sp. TRM 70351 TaxID=3116552 RepID=UPI002E7C4F7F|nr:DUF4429 domain-containing protein [Streptomyces sp. TRM 70351]MEE1928970.1 DUF4429 domain-containing protein [Streptomyces sp. TRM 70351]